MKLLNKSARVIFAGDVMLVPARPLEVGDVDKLTEKYPILSDFIKAGDLVKVSAGEAEKAELDFEKANLAMLKKAAEDKGLDTSNAKTKQDYINLLKG